MRTPARTCSAVSKTSRRYRPSCPGHPACQAPDNPTRPCPRVNSPRPRSSHPERRRRIASPCSSPHRAMCSPGRGQLRIDVSARSLLPFLAERSLKIVALVEDVDRLHHCPLGGSVVCGNPLEQVSMHVVVELLHLRMELQRMSEIPPRNEVVACLHIHEQRTRLHEKDSHGLDPDDIERAAGRMNLGYLILMETPIDLNVFVSSQIDGKAPSCHNRFSTIELQVLSNTPTILSTSAIVFASGT